MAWPFSRSPKERIAPTLRNASLENPSTSLSDPAAWLFESFGAAPSFAGPSVSETSAMRFSAVFACVSLKAGLIGELPLKVYKKTATGREDASDHRLYPLLHDEPNDLMSSYIWKELMGMNVLLAGNHYSIIEYDQAARIIGFMPVLPRSVLVERVSGRNRYTFSFVDGPLVLDQEDVLHVPGIGFDGLKGISPIAWAGRQPIGIGLAMEEATGRMHSNGMRPSVAITLPPKLDKPAMLRMKAEIDGLYTGVTNHGRPIYLDNGASIEPMQITPEDAQTLESRRFQVSDICRIFGVPPHMIGETDKTTSWGTGIEQQTIGFLKFSLAKDLSRIEGELNRKLFKAPYYCEFDREALAAMDAETQAALFASAINNAGMTPNEVRRKRNLPDQPGGDELYIQSATIPLSKAGQIAPSPAKPAPPAPPVKPSKS
jgi:HK97 family phage portal protein